MIVDFSKIKAVILDFDCTVTREHTGGCAQSVDKLTDEYIQDNTKDLFVEFVVKAQACGIRLYIATYGDDSFAQNDEDVAGHALVMRYMDHLFGAGQTFFKGPQRNAGGDITRYHNVIARCSGDRKAFHLDIVLNDLGAHALAHEVLFVDDSTSNLDYAYEQGCQLMVPRAPDTSALVSADERVFSLLIDRLSVMSGAIDALE